MRVVVIAVLVLVAVAAAVAAVAVAGFFWVIRMRKVGPDGDQLAEDPVLHIAIEGASPGTITARTGSEGGPMPAMANRTSEAYRYWALDSADWQSALIAAARQVDAHGVLWRSLRSSPKHVRLRGVKDVAVGKKVVSAGVAVEVNRIEAWQPTAQLMIRLASDGWPLPSGSPAPATRIDGECPPAIVEAFNALCS